MEVSNNVIFALGQAGIATLNYLGLDTAHAYKAYKLRRAITRAYQDISEQRTEIIRAAYGPDAEKAEAYERDRAHNNPKTISDEEYGKIVARVQKDVMPSITQLFSETTDIPVAAKLPFEEWVKLLKENARIFAAAADIIVPRKRDAEGKPLGEPAVFIFDDIFAPFVEGMEDDSKPAKKKSKK